MHTTFDLMAECDNAEAVGWRLNTLRNDLAFIWTVADATPNAFCFECAGWDSFCGDRFLE